MKLQTRLKEQLQDALQELDGNIELGHRTNVIYWSGLIAKLATELASKILTGIAEEIQTEEDYKDAEY